MAPGRKTKRIVKMKGRDKVVGPRSKKPPLSVSVDAPPPGGFKAWRTKTGLSNGRPLTTMAKYNANTMQFSHQVDVRHQNPFTLRPVVITKGPLKGKRALLLEDIVPFRFLELPPEIRQMIYRLLLEEPQQITIVQDKPYRSSIAKLVVSTFHDEKLHKGLVFDATARKWQKQEPSPLAIMRVRKLLLQESAAVMYGENSFSLSDTSRLKEFLVAIGTMRQHLRFVSVRAHGYTASAIRSAFNLLKAAKGLRALTFHYTSISTFSRYGLVGPDRRQSRQDAARSFVSDCRPLLRVLQKAQKDVEVPVDVLSIITVGWEEMACYDCSEGNYSLGCRRVSDGSCGDLPGDCSEINAQIRELAAKELGIKMST